MPILDNPKHEAFARRLAEGCSLVDAYERAGYGRNRGNAARLNADESIRGRVQELQQEAAKELPYTLQWVCEGLVRMLKLAEQVGSPAAGVSALMGIAKMNGMLIDKVETKDTTDIASQVSAARRRARLGKEKSDRDEAEKVG
jgi:hypothetical protein